MSTNHSPYKLIAIDLDGTLIGRDLSISPRARAAIRRAIETGIKVTIASGRMFKSVLRFAQELNLQTPLICYQGALIKDPVSQETLWHKTVPLELARQIIPIVEARGIHINAYVDDELYVSRVTAEAEGYARLSIVQAHPVGDLVTFLQREPTKLVAISDAEQIDRLTRELASHFGSSLYITKSYPIFCEIAHPECSKGKALARLAERLGIAQEETVAIGDNPNDLDMIAWAGLGIAMANSSPEVIAAADWVTGSVEEDGAAQAIEKVLNTEATCWGQVP